MRVTVEATSCNVVQYINALQKVDRGAVYRDGLYGGYVLMELNTVEELQEIIKWVGRVIALPFSNTKKEACFTLEIYDDYRE